MTQPYETSAIDTATMNDLLKRVAELEDQLQTHTGDAQGSAGQFYPHPVQMIDSAEFGGGVMRLDPLTIQVQLPDNSNGKNVISVVDAYQGTQTLLDAHHPRIFYIAIRNGNLLENQIQVNRDGTGLSSIDMKDYTGTESSITLGTTYATVFGSAVIKITASDAYFTLTDNVFLWLGGRNSEPSHFRDGMVWHRDDLLKLRLRTNSLTQNVALEALTLAAVTKSGTYTATATDCYIRCDATTAAFTVTLPAATASGKVYVIKKADSSAHAVTIAAAGADTIQGAATISLAAQYNSRTLADTAAGGWEVIAST